MNYWLIKSEPSAWSWQQQVKAGAKGTAWTGVRNHLAKKHLQTMQMGDLCFFYHSNEGKEIVGLAEVVKTAYPDPTDKTQKFVAVDVRAEKPLKTSVTLAQIKTVPQLQNMALLKCARLSVQPVTAIEWKMICGMGGI